MLWSEISPSMQSKACLVPGPIMLKEIDCLKKLYEEPKLIHHTHIRAILDTPALKRSNGKELQ